MYSEPVPRDPRHPKVVERFDGAGDLSFLHSFVRLPTGGED